MVKLENIEGLFDPTYIQYFTIPLPPDPAPMNMTFDDDCVYNLSYLKHLSQCHKWHEFLPTNLCHNT